MTPNIWNRRENQHLSVGQQRREQKNLLNDYNHNYITNSLKQLKSEAINWFRRREDRETR